MSLPRPVFRNRFYMLTRRCTQRQFLMRPDDATNNNFLYCLAEAAKRFGIVVVLPQMMSNHHHTLLFDRDGRINEFTEHFHKMFAKSQNALRGRWENLWSSEPPCLVELVTRKAVMRTLVYIATNPVKDGLVERVHHWPGIPAYAALVYGRTLTARRPEHFFRSDGPMPETVTLECQFPPELGDAASLRAELKRRVEMAEDGFAKSRRRKRRCVLGRARVLRQSWRESPTSREPRRELRPRVAAQSRWARIAALQRDKAFVRKHRLARSAWLSGSPIPFPAGTYWMRRFMNVPVIAEALTPPFLT